MSVRGTSILPSSLAVMAGLFLASTTLVGDACGQMCHSAQPATYVASYVPSGNYAAVTAFSPPAVQSVPVVANYAPVAVAAPASSIAVTSSYSPQVRPVAVAAYYAPTATAVPVTSYYAPTAAAAYYAPTAAAVPVTSYYAPTAAAVPVTAYYAAPVAAPAVVAPVAAYYPPTVVARRGLFGATRYSYYPGAWYSAY